MKSSTAQRPKTLIRVLSIGSSHVVAGEFETDKRGQLKLVKFAAEDLGPAQQSDEAIHAETSAAIAKVVTQFSRKKGELRVVVPGHWALAKVVKVPAVALAQQERIIQFEAEQSIPFSLDEVVWDYQILRETDNAFEVMFAAVKGEKVEALLPRLGSMHSNLAVVRSAGLLNHLVAEKQEAARAQSTLLISIGARSTHLVFKNGPHFLLRSLSLGGSTLSKCIADKLEMSLTEAEQLKLRVLRQQVELPPDSPVGQTVSEAVASFRDKLLLEIKRSLVTFRRQEQGGNTESIVLAGGAGDLPGLDSWLQEKLGWEVSHFSTFANFKIAPELNEKIERFGRSRLFDLEGAMESESAGGGAINLVPKSVTEARDSEAKRPRWIIAALLFFLSVLLPGVHFQRLAKAREVAAAKIGQQLGPVYELQERNRLYIEWLNTAGREAKFLAELGDAQVAWPGFLADLQQQLWAVQDVWLERLLILPNELEESVRNRVPAEEEEATEITLQSPLRLRLSGRLLDRENPLSRVSQSSYERVTALLNRMVESEFVMAVEGERFDAGEPGILRFDFTLVINPAKLL